MKAAAMVVLDFSGTLSLQATLFARPENLARALQASGLWRLGINSVQMFWDEIINPTWEEGSTTPKGYLRLLYERAQQVLLRRGRAPDAQEILAAVGDFADRYFRHSVIDPAWEEPIARSLAWPRTRVVVATDHYAEATARISEQLESLGISCVPSLHRARYGQIIVANSADLGYHKASRGFWEALQKAQDMEAFSTIAVVDDFGANEYSLDAYADPSRVAERLNKTIALLSAVFGARVVVFPFLISQAHDAEAKDPEGTERAYRELIRDAAGFIAAQLGPPAIGGRGQEA